MIQLKHLFALLFVSWSLHAAAQSFKQPTLTSGGNVAKAAPQTPHAHTPHSCGYKQVTDAIVQNNPAYAQALIQHQNAIQQVSQADLTAKRSPQAVIEIPVVVHVINQGEALGVGRNISDARIIAQLNVLNTDFRKQNANWASGTPTIFKAAGADVEIHFCLAKTNPTGGTTTGIDRQNKTVTGSDVQTSNIETATTGVKALYKWDPTRYLNIYVLPIPGTSNLGGVIGYSYIPFTGVVGSYQDGIVIDYRWFGQAGQAGLSGGGRSLTHECGHYFGLPHIWADASDNGGCTADDGIADTPEQDDATSNNAAFNCAAGVAPVSCGTQNMYIDYMDYLDDDACYTQFTAGQKAVMRSVLTGAGASFGLQNRTALVNNGLTQCSACTMTAATSGITAITCAAAGTATATATNVPTGNTATFAWSNGATTAALSTTNSGTYTVTITANATCIATATAIINNTCTSLCDTLSNYDLAADSARLYSAVSPTSSGFASGNNSFGHLAKADFFDYSTGANTHIKGFYIAFGYAKDAAPTTNVNLRVWSANGTGGVPNTIIATKTVSLTAIRTAVLAQNYIQYYEFPTPIALPANKKFYVGVDLPTTAGDTLALITNQVGAMTAGTGTAWQKLANATWVNYNNPNGGFNADLAHLIAPVLGTATVAAFTPTTTSVTCNTPLTFNSTTSTNASIRSWSFVGGTPATSTATSPSVTYASAGTYTVQLITQNACLADTVTGTVTVTCPSCTLAATTTTVITSCNRANGSATVAPTGGTPPYTYAWSNAATTATISNVAAGTYTVTVTAGVGCSITKTAIVGASIAITNTMNAVATSCNLANGGASVVASGGISPYTYAWSNAATTVSIANVVAGTYTVTVTGGVGCTKTSTVVIATSTALTATSTATATSCNLANGTATVAPTGGATTYTYAWSNAGTTATISNIAAGTYTVTVTGGVGCSTTRFVTVATSAALTLTGTGTPTTCGLANGGASVTATGGATPYTYLWSNAATTAAITNVASGTYTVTVTGGAGCTSTRFVTVAASTGLTLTNVFTGTTCGLANGSAGVTITGSPAPYTYVWSNAATTASISNLVGGVYTVTVTASDGCTRTRFITVATSTPITVNPTSTNTSCGLANGTATVAPTGGATPYIYAWSNSNTTAAILNLATATYTVTITGGANCSATATVIIASSTPLIASISSNGTTCGLTNGTITASATGGATPYTYAWGNGSVTPSLNNLAAGTYTVTVLGGVGCTTTAVGVVIASSRLTLTTTSTQTQQGQATGTATATPTGVAPYTYAWNIGGTTATISNLAAGTYTVTATGANGCTSTAFVDVTTIIGTYDLKGLQNLTIYPNPAANEFNIDADFEETTNLNITLTNALGQVLLSGNFIVQAHILQPIDMESAAAGIYFITLKTDNGQTIRKVVISK